MMVFNYLIWNASPEIFSIGSFGLRWYGLLFAVGFLLSQQVMYYIFRKEGKREKDVDTLTVYMVVATILGARLGHVIFYQPELFIQDPLSIILPFEFSPFRFTGLQGLASHGAAFAVLFALWLFSRKKIHQISFLQIVDRVVIVTALIGALIRLGNFFNSEIIGLPSTNPLSVVFINRVTESIKDKKDSPVEYVKVERNKELPEGSNGRVPIFIYVVFKPGVDQARAQSYLDSDVAYYINYFTEYVDNQRKGLNYKSDTDGAGNITARISTLGIARHPAQLYESISCVILFVILFLIWNHRKENTPTGLIFGVFMIILWGLRFAYEFLKEDQVAFEQDMTLNMGQILSIPLFVAGIIILIRALRNKKQLPN
ncbi:MAG: prolipoprotein diacylglyceryl transferase [Cyclobacteriaceae bacterium]|nr:prolipoprotein diacylglyceryl transferase [Cyclobacteriaceae bacterium]